MGHIHTTGHVVYDEEPVKRQGAEVGRTHPVYETPRPGGVLSPCPRETCFSGSRRAPGFSVAASETWPTAAPCDCGSLSARQPWTACGAVTCYGL